MINPSINEVEPRININGVASIDYVCGIRWWCCCCVRVCYCHRSTRFWRKESVVKVDSCSAVLDRL